VTLAVLPLVNLSGDSAQEYFSDGMTEEIIGKLSRLRSLAVSARTSVVKYKGTAVSPRQIGAELGVTYLLEGSVRRAGDRIRVQATLLKAADAFQIWSEDIDATMDDVFDVQERVAARIVEALNVRLSPEETRALRQWGTRNAEAYDEYLKGEVLVAHFHMLDKLEAARRHFERALEIDPVFAPAMAGLASAEAQIYRNVQSRPEGLDRAEAFVRRALAIDPRLVRARMAAAEIRAMRYDYTAAVELFRDVVAEEPSNYVAWDYLCWALGYMVPPQVAEAERACRSALEINSVYAESYYHLARVLIPQGRLAEAERSIAYVEEHYPRSSLASAGRFWLYLATKRPREALAALGPRDGGDRTSLRAAWAAMAYAQLGELDRAFAALDEAVSLGYRDVADLRTSPYFEPLRRDRRFEPFVAEHGLAP
jgi:adenylate cyclase